MALSVLAGGVFQPVAIRPTGNESIQPKHDFIQLYLLVKHSIAFYHIGQQEARKWGKTCKVSRFAPVDYIEQDRNQLRTGLFFMGASLNITHN